MSPFTRRAVAAATLMVALSPAVMAAESTKDIVLDRINAPVTAVVGPAAAAAPTARSEAMAVSVLLESADGTLTPRAADKMFRTGDRFRVKLLASRDAKVALYNTNPKGVLTKEPIWTGEVKVGQETITPRLRLEGNSGVDLLHIVLEPAKEQGILSWLTGWLSKTKDGTTSKDISLDVQNTESATYLLSNKGQGLVTTMRIVHR